MTPPAQASPLRWETRRNAAAFSITIVQNSAANGPAGSTSDCSRSAAQRANASIMLLRVDGVQAVLRRLAHQLRAERVGDDQPGVLGENLARHLERGGEEQPVAMRAVVHPFLVGAEILDRGLDLDDPDLARRVERGRGRRAARTAAATRSPPRSRTGATAAWCRARPRARSATGGRRRAACGERGRGAWRDDATMREQIKYELDDPRVDHRNVEIGEMAHVAGREFGAPREDNAGNHRVAYFHGNAASLADAR